MKICRAQPWKQMSYSQAELIREPTPEDPNFELWMPTQAMLKINLRDSFADDDITKVLASVTHIARDGHMQGPNILNGPDSEYISPKKTLVLCANEEEVKSKGTLFICGSMGSLKRVKIFKHGRVSDVQTIQNGIVYTKLKGYLVENASDCVQDRTVLVNEEGAFLINVVRKDGPSSSNNGDAYGSQLSQQVLRNAQGAYLINTAR